MSAEQTGIEELVVEAARPVPLLWPLSSSVATNPLWDLRALPFPAAIQAQQRLLGINGYPPPPVLADAWAAGRITSADLATALERADPTRSPNTRPAGVPSVEAVPAAMTLLEHHDQHRGTALAGRADREVSRWCATFAAGGIPGPRGTAGTGFGGFYRAWREVVAADPVGRRLQLGPLVAQLGSQPDAAVSAGLELLGIGSEDRLGELAGQLTRQVGWAAYAKWRTLWAAPDDARPFLHLVDYMAVRLAYDLALLKLAESPEDAARRAPRTPERRYRSPDGSPAVPDPSIVGGVLGTRLASLAPDRAAGVWLAAYENHFRDRLLAALHRSPRRPDDRPPVAQVICCIDVRAEGLRRHLETRGAYQTFGIAGFFGIPARVRALGSGEAVDLCPVLVRPSVEISQKPRDGRHPSAVLAAAEDAAATRAAVAAARENAVAPYLLAEAMGMALAPLAVLRTAAPRAFARLRRWFTELAAPEPSLENELSGPAAPDDETQALLAENALRSIGLTERFAPLVVICGHGSTTENNPYGSALDCGACGAARGATSARLASAIFNRERVRTLLAERGIAIPNDTLFVAAEHDTATDTVALFPAEQREPNTQHLELLRALAADLTAAGAAVAAERSATLAGLDQAHPRRAVLRQVATRSVDWAQVQPEWGLARNAAFIVAPRRLSEGVDLERRTFLHSYEPAADPDGAVLEAILSGPVVVAHWINAAYYFSTVDPETLGAGDKAAHNIVAGIGVSLGAGSDLRLGLPYQAVFDRGHPYHEPVRLLVLIEAPRGRIDTVVARNRVLSDLVEGGWFHVAARDGGQFWSRASGGRWHPWEPAAVASAR